MSPVGTVQLKSLVVVVVMQTTHVTKFHKATYTHTRTHTHTIRACITCGIRINSMDCINVSFLIWTLYYSCVRMLTNIEGVWKNDTQNFLVHFFAASCESTIISNYKVFCKTNKHHT